MKTTFSALLFAAGAVALPTARRNDIDGKLSVLDKTVTEASNKAIFERNALIFASELVAAFNGTSTGKIEAQSVHEMAGARCPTNAEVHATPHHMRWNVWDAGTCHNTCRISNCGGNAPCCVKNVVDPGVALGPQGPRGPKGDRGPAGGPQGPAGPQGPKGDTGVTPEKLTSIENKIQGFLTTGCVEICKRLTLSTAKSEQDFKDNDEVCGSKDYDASHLAACAHWQNTYAEQCLDLYKDFDQNCQPLFPDVKASWSSTCREMKRLTEKGDRKFANRACQEHMKATRDAQIKECSDASCKA